MSNPRDNRWELPNPAAPIWYPRDRNVGVSLSALTDRHVMSIWNWLMHHRDKWLRVTMRLQPHWGGARLPYNTVFPTNEWPQLPDRRQTMASKVVVARDIMAIASDRLEWTAAWLPIVETEMKRRYISIPEWKGEKVRWDQFQVDSAPALSGAFERTLNLPGAIKHITKEESLIARMRLEEDASNRVETAEEEEQEPDKGILVTALDKLRKLLDSK
jgi:hypothetical protein